MSKQTSVLATSFVVTGNLIGAGILALPVKTGLSGLIPSLVGIVLMWAFMLSTAMILAAQPALSESETSDLPTFFQRELGTAGKWLTVAANMIILYGLLVAYLSGVASILHDLTGLSPALMMAGFFIVATTITLFGMEIMARGNAIIMVVLWSTFAVLVFLCARQVDTAHLEFSNWPFLPAALPIVVTAFHFHNIIPSICRSLNHDQKAIRKAMLLGTLIGLAMNSIWVIVVIGALPVEGGGNSLVSAFQHNLPATIPLSRIITSPLFLTCASVFSIMAITSSYMANGMALNSFMRDLCSRPGRPAPLALSAALAFIPPLAIATFYPNVFLKALDVVGGVGIDFIFGILPGVLVLKYAKGTKRLFGWLLIAVFGFVLAFELAQEFGLLSISPDMEHWNSHLPR